MKLMKRMAAAMLCIAVTGSLVATAAFAADSETTTTELDIESMAIVSGYYRNYDQYKDDNTLRIGGGGKRVDSQSYDVLSDYNNADAIMNWYNNSNHDGDICISFIRFTLPEDASDTDTYTLKMTNNGQVSSRYGTLDVYAGIADVNTAVISENDAPGDEWESITWNSRPTISNLQLVATSVSTSDRETVSIDITGVLEEQSASNTVTIALIGKWNTQIGDNNNGVEGYYKDVTITRTTTAEPEDIVEALSPVEKITDDTSDADSDSVGFVGHVKVTGTSQIGFNVSNNSANVDWIFDTEITDATVVYGLVITDLSESGLAVDDITATYLQ